MNDARVKLGLATPSDVTGSYDPGAGVVIWRSMVWSSLVDGSKCPREKSDWFVVIHQKSATVYKSVQSIDVAMEELFIWLHLPYFIPIYIGYG